ncbi:hypothetical protein GUJ93_ZPchr0013g34872 [Zizania palustris]|uniref:Uncharacterized protein n=1 Tax=Zizania palustris TaxID=103762 RepID=A0A8J5WVW9_ZIZPA|nr:hypothetical protein GUJ93_ZPchr0013g34872 [Zizania palustris]
MVHGAHWGICTASVLDTINIPSSTPLSPAMEPESCTWKHPCDIIEVVVKGIGNGEWGHRAIELCGTVGVAGTGGGGGHGRGASSHHAVNGELVVTEVEPINFEPCTCVCGEDQEATLEEVINVTLKQGLRGIADNHLEAVLCVCVQEGENTCVGGGNKLWSADD